MDKFKEGDIIYIKDDCNIEWIVSFSHIENNIMYINKGYCITQNRKLQDNLFPYAWGEIEFMKEYHIATDCESKKL